MNSMFTKPEFYDIFGILVFIFITTLASWMLYTKKKPVRWLLIILLMIGILGLIVDAIMVYVNYIK